MGDTHRINMKRLGTTTLDVSTSVVTLADADTDYTATSGVRVFACQVDPAGGNLRTTLDGTDPVGATTGKRYDGGYDFEITGADIKTAEFIRDAGTDAIVWIDVYGAAV